MHAALSARINKTDSNDAMGIAQMMRVGLFKPVQVKTPASQQRRLLLTSRKLLQRKAYDIESDLRGRLHSLPARNDRDRTMTLRIHGYAASINVRKVLWACDEMELAYDRIDRGGGFCPGASPDFLALSPFGMVPVIEDEGLVLSESNAIIRYLAARHHRRDLLPDEARARGRVEMWMDWQATEFNNAWRPAFLGVVRKRPEFQDEEMIQRSMEQFNAMVGILDGQLERTGAYVAGEAFTLADIPIGLFVHCWHAMPMDKPSFTHVEAYYRRLSNRPAFDKHGHNGGP